MDDDAHWKKGFMKKLVKELVREQDKWLKM